jgi:hypothetical protein
MVRVVFSVHSAVLTLSLHHPCVIGTTAGLVGTAGERYAGDRRNGGEIFQSQWTSPVYEGDRFDRIEVPCLDRDQGLRRNVTLSSRVWAQEPQ